MKKNFNKKIFKLASVGLIGAITLSMNILAFADTQLVDVDLWNATSDKASMGNVATDNNSYALYNSDNNTIQVAFNPVNISGYISGVTELLYDKDGSGNFEKANILETGKVDSGTRNDGNNYEVEYIQILEINIPNNLSKSGVEYIDIQIKVPHTPMDVVMADGYLDARLKIDWNNVKDTELEKIVSDSTLSGGEIVSVSMQDKSSGIKIISDSSKILSEASLYVEKITSGDDFEKAKITLETDDFTLFDIRLGANGEEVFMSGASEVRVPYAGANMQVYRISADGNKTLLRGTADVGEYSFLTNQTGLVAIVGGVEQSITLVEGATDNGALRDFSATSTPTPISVEFQNPFTDINSHWAKDNILYAVQNGLFTGTTDTTFSPDSNMTGAMVITVLHRIAGEPEVSTSDTNWYGKQVEWGKQNNIIGGYNEFDPNKDVTREEFTTMLYNFEKLNNTRTTTSENLSSNFADFNSVSDWAKDGILWSVSNEIITGITKDGQTNIAPSDSASRAVIATMLGRYIDL
ncbi:MAG: S-layer homology domain-containing protein [bacterium]